MKKIFLIDAYALVYRSYYALMRSPRINSKGLNTSAIMGFMNTIQEVLTKEQPTHIAVAFDHGKTFRHEAYPPYKAQREETPEDIKMSVPIIKDLLTAMNVPILQVDGYEADDIIGTIAKRFGSADNNIDTAVYMLTPDKDYAQLVEENIFMYKPRHGGGYDIMGPKEVCDKYTIPSTSLVIDLLALMGDSADNFPGCPGVGEKTAIKLINQWGTCEDIISHRMDIPGALGKKVQEHVEDIKISKFLARIATDIPEEKFESYSTLLRDMEVGNPDIDRLTALLDDLELRNIKSKLLKGVFGIDVPEEKTAARGKKTQSVNKSKKQQTTANLELDLFATEPSIRTENQNNGLNFEEYSTPTTSKGIDTKEDAKKLCDFILTKQFIGFSLKLTERAIIDPIITEIQFAEVHPSADTTSSADGDTSWSIIITDGKMKDGTPVAEVIDIFRPVFESGEIMKVGEDIKQDIETLHQFGVNLCICSGSDHRLCAFDTMIADYLIQPEIRHYVTKEVSTIRRDYPTLLARLNSIPGLYDLFANVEMPLTEVLADMEMNGVSLDTTTLAEVSKTFNERILEHEQRIYQLAGKTFNIASPKQVGDILFGEMKITDKPKRTKTGQYVTSEEVLQQLRKDNPIVDEILLHRQLKKLIGTYVDSLPKLINPKTGHIHTSFNQCVTATGRLSSSDPNLQNIPVRGEDGKEIRKCFGVSTPRHERKGQGEGSLLWFSADYSQIELRVMAHLSQDEHMIDAFRNGFDVHAATAANVYGKAREEVTRDERTKAKRANFGLIYGISTWGLSQGLMIDRKEAKALMDGFFQTFPKVEQYMEWSKDIVRQREAQLGKGQGFAETLLHRRRYLPQITDNNATVRNFSERNAINAPIQGTAADIIKIAMVRIFRRFKDENLRSKMILQVHDELNFSVIPEERDIVQNIVITEMQQAYSLSVPLVADYGWGDNWLEAH